MSATLYSMFNSLKSGLLHLTGQSNSRKGRTAKVKDGIISETKFLGAISVDPIQPMTNTLAFSPILMSTKKFYRMGTCSK